MPQVASRNELIEYCLRKLGFPVIEINVDDDQVEDRVDDAFQTYRDYHFDSQERQYLKHTITDEDVENGFFPVPNAFMHVQRVLPFGRTGNGIYPMNDPNLVFKQIPGGMQYRAGDYYYSATSSNSDHAGAGSGGSPIVDYFMAGMGAQLMEDMFGGEKTIRFSRHTDRLFIDDMPESGSIVVVEGWAVLDPDEFNQVYNDRWLKRYLTALIKQQWGQNLIKYSGIDLPGGVTFDGDKIYDQATEEITRLEEEMELTYSEPVTFYMA